LEGLKTLAQDPWVDFALISVNHKGYWMDAPAGEKLEAIERRNISMPHIHAIHKAGVGITSMKTFAANGFEKAGDRKECLRFIRDEGCVDSMPIRFKTQQELDEVIQAMQELSV
jgi:hypothetical protein